MHVRRHALAITAAELLPVPLLDTWTQNRVRRHLVRTVSEARGQQLSDDEVHALADEPYDPVRRLAVWPVKAVLKKLLFVTAPFLLYRTYRQAVGFGEDLTKASDDQNWA